MKTILEYLQGKNRTGYAMRSGPSFAAPLVTRVAAAIKSRNAQWKPARIKEELIYYTEDHIDELTGIKFRTLNMKRLKDNYCNDK